MEEVMDSSGPDATQVYGILLAMQKNLECPICLEIMKAPVSTHCAHVFCSFCILKLLGQKKGVTKCPLCNGKISKSTLQEDVRFKLVIKAVLEAVGALECDTGFNFLGDRCLHEKAAVLQENQMVVESKGYRGRLNGVKTAEKRKSALSKSSCLPLPNRIVTRGSLMKKSGSNKTVYFEIGSDSSEDLIEKKSTVRCVGRRESSQPQDGKGHAGKRSQSPCHVELQEPDGEDVVLLGTPEACGLSEAGRDFAEGPRASPGNGGAVKENDAVKKRQDLTVRVPSTGRHRGQPVSSSAQKDCSCIERPQLVVEAADPAPNKEAGSEAEMVSLVQPAGSAHSYDHICEDEQELLQPQAYPESPLSQVSGKKLNQSIQKVNEWFLKSKALSPAPSQDVNAEERDSSPNPYLPDGGRLIFQETELMEDQWEIAAGREVGRPVSKPVASGMVDKIFGRTYQRTRKSNRFCIPEEEGCAAVDATSCETLLRKIPARKRVTSEVISEDVMKKQTVVEDSEGPGRNASSVLEEDGHGFDGADRAPGAARRPAELPVQEGASGLEWQSLKKPRHSLSRRRQRPSKPVCPLQLATQGSSGSPEKAQPDVNPSREGSREGSSDQMHLRRSKRLLSQAGGEQQENEPAKKRRKRLDECEKKQKETQAGNASPLATEGSPNVLQGRQLGMAGDASKARASPHGEGSLSVECPAERDSPYHIVPDASSQGSCSLLQRHLPKGEPSDLKAREFAAVPRAEQSAVGAQAPGENGFCPRDAKESRGSPRVQDKAAGNRELHPETEDSELDAGFVWTLFHRCKRRSFLLHPAPSKKPATGALTELSISQVEDSEADDSKKSTPGVVSEVRREAASSSESNRLPVVSQAAFPNSLCMPVTVKEAGSGDPLQSPTPASNQKESSEVEKTSNANDCSCGSSGPCRRGNCEGTSLHPADEMSSKTTQFLETRPGNDQNKASVCSFCSEPIQPPSVGCQPPSSQSRSGSVENKSGPGEQKQRKGTGEQTVRTIGVDVSEGHSEQQSPKDETPGFVLSSATPEGLLDPAPKSSLNPWEVDQQDAWPVFAKTDQGSPLEKDLECCSSGSGSGAESLAQTHRRRVQKLSSSEEDSSEDEELPCFQALIFGESASTPSQLTKEEEALAEIPALRNSNQSSPKSQGEAGSPSQESEGSVNLFSSQSHASEDSTSKPCDARLLTPVPTSQGKVMTPRTATEPLGKICRDAGLLQDEHQDYINAEPCLGEALDYDSEVSHLGDSSGFSSQSEILTTQQKNAMQNNLKKLQQEMAILQAALKEGGQDAATEVLPLPDGLPAALDSSVNTKSPEPVLQQAHEPGGTSQVRYGSRQSLLTASPPPGSVHRIPDDCSTSSSTSQEHVLCDLAAEPEQGPSVAIQDAPNAPEHESQGRPVSSLAAATIHSGRKGNSKSLHSTSQRNMSLVASGLLLDELRLVHKFSRKTKSTWSHTFSKDTTHVIMKTDEDLVCERTLKYFLGIAARKWVVSYQWVLQSLKEGTVLNEGDFEVRGDIINGRNHQGPKRARESPTGKLFQGLEICCYGPFTDMQREQLEWMVELCGASLVKQPHLFSSSTDSTKAVVVIQPDAWQEDSSCQGIPPHCSATVVAREWVLDSVACYQCMAFDDYILQQE